MAVYKNKAGQKVAVFAVDTNNGGAPYTGIDTDITAQISKDGGACAATNDVNPTELDPDNAKGVYLFELTQAETNADMIVLSPVGSMANCLIRPVVIYTEPEQRVAASVAAGGITAASIATGAIDAGAIAAGAITNAKFAAGAIDNVAIADGAIDAGAFASSSIVAGTFAANAITAAALAADAVTEIQSGLASEATLTAVKAKTDALPASPAATGDIPAANITAIKAKTDALPAAPAAVGDIPDSAAIQSAAASAIAAAALATAANLATVDTVVDGIKLKTDNLPAAPAAVGDIPTANANAAALLASTVDTLTVSKLLQAVLAVLGGVAVVNGSTVSFKARDGSTEVVSITYGAEAGERTVSGVS
jgi:hypothetical protein